jgi:alpha-tubulin suppressor-like RCC1 family protein
MDLVAGCPVAGSQHRRLTLILAAIIAALTMAIAAPAQAHAPNTAKAWGFNKDGELGNGTETEHSDVPVAVSGLSGVTAVSGGSRHSIALLKGGNVMSWGANGEGQLGNGTTTGSDVPVTVCAAGTVAPCATHLEGVTAISAGANHSLALLKNGMVMAWGANSVGQLGNGTTTESDVPVAVSGLSEVRAVAAGNDFSLALRKNGTVMAWGYGGEGQLGNGTETQSDVPVEVSKLSGVTAVSAGGRHGLALLKNGTVMAWGENSAGELGDGTITNHDVPVEVSELNEVMVVSAGGSHSLALLRNGTVVAWGLNALGQLGDGTSAGPETCGTTVPVPCSKKPVAACAGSTPGPCPTGPYLSEVTGISGGGTQSLALLLGGTVKAWGFNSAGQLGDGTIVGPETCAPYGSCSATPVAVCAEGPETLCPSGPYLIGATRIAAGQNFGLALGPPPAVTALKPKRGPASGGTTVTITGTDFTGATAVKFGSTSAASFTVNSATSISAVSPAEPVGPVDVTVTNTWGTSPESSADRFTFTPTVTGVNPTSGPAAGGTSVTVTGSGFALGTTATKFKFGTRTGTSVNCTSSTTCTVVAPAHIVGTVDVQATVNSLSSPKNSPADHFTYE